MDSYVYLTAKVLWVTADNPGNRPGWHSDGFMTDDLNYIWSDSNGTVFWSPDKTRSFSQDHAKSLREMEEAAEAFPNPYVVYADKHLLRLDERVIHRTPDITTPGIRSFVKVSVSKHKYNLIGNSINHELPINWKMYSRAEVRNHPTMQDFVETSGEDLM